MKPQTASRLSFLPTALSLALGLPLALALIPLLIHYFHEDRGFAILCIAAVIGWGVTTVVMFRLAR